MRCHDSPGKSSKKPAENFLKANGVFTREMVKIWQGISEEFEADLERKEQYDQRLYFELYNEPSDSAPRLLLGELYRKLYATIRGSSPKRKLVIGGSHENAIDQLDVFENSQSQITFNSRPIDFAADPRVFFTFHYYAPYCFTHQGADWGGKHCIEVENRKWPEVLTDRRILCNDLRSLLLLKQPWPEIIRANRLFLGEFGTINKADQESRRVWTGEVLLALRSVGSDLSNADQDVRIGFIYWDYSSDNFGLVDVHDRTKWNKELKGELYPTEKGQGCAGQTGKQSSPAPE